MKRIISYQTTVTTTRFNTTAGTITSTTGTVATGINRITGDLLFTAGTARTTDLRLTGGAVPGLILIIVPDGHHRLASITATHGDTAGMDTTVHMIRSGDILQCIRHTITQVEALHTTTDRLITTTIRAILS